MRKAISVIVLTTILSGASYAQALPPAAPTPAAAAPAPLNPATCVLVALRMLQPRTVPSLAAVINLTDNQKNKVTDLLTKAEKDSEPAVMAQRQAAQDFVALLTNKGASESDLRAAAIRAESAEQVLIIDKIKTLTALRGHADSRSERCPIEVARSLDGAVETHPSAACAGFRARADEVVGKKGSPIQR